MNDNALKVVQELLSLLSEMGDLGDVAEILEQGIQLDVGLAIMESKSIDPEVLTEYIMEQRIKHTSMEPPREFVRSRIAHTVAVLIEHGHVSEDGTLEPDFADAVTRLKEMRSDRDDNPSDHGVKVMSVRISSEDVNKIMYIAVARDKEPIDEALVRDGHRGCIAESLIRQLIECDEIDAAKEFGDQISNLTDDTPAQVKFGEGEDTVYLIAATTAEQRDLMLEAALAVKQ